MAYKYKRVALGGTFDLLHKGHKSLLTKAFAVSGFVTIGITTDKMLKASGKTPYEDQEKRRKNLQSYLASNKLTKRSKLVWLNDVYGPAINDRKLDTLIVSKETLANANLINKERFKRKLKKLKIIICPQILAQDKKPISSDRIRSGEIDRAGQSYSQILQKLAGRPVSEKARLMLKNPLGPLVKLDKVMAKKYPPFIAVGDISVANFLRLGITPKISIVDFLVQRQKRYNQLAELGFATNNPDAIIKNPPGQVSQELINEISKSIKSKNRSIILVDGEEDLAAIPAVLFSPLGKYVYYGQPQKGAVRIVVTENIKEELFAILNSNLT